MLVCITNKMYVFDDLVRARINACDLFSFLWSIVALVKVFEGCVYQ